MPYYAKVYRRNDKPLMESHVFDGILSFAMYLPCAFIHRFAVASEDFRLLGIDRLDNFG